MSRSRCFGARGVPPAELHKPALKSTETNCTTLCTSSAAGGEKRAFPADVSHSLGQIWTWHKPEQRTEELY